MPQQEPSYWLMKSEPEAYSIDTLKKDGVTLWAVSYTHLRAHET